jgi:hypothetical protein
MINVRSNHLIFEKCNSRLTCKSRAFYKIYTGDGKELPSREHFNSCKACIHIALERCERVALLKEINKKDKALNDV